MATTEGDEKWQSAKRELEDALAELRKELADMRSVLGGVRAQLGSSSPSPVPPRDPLQAASESSETGNDHRMTFEEFANASQLRF